MKLSISEQTCYNIREDTYRKSLPIIIQYMNILGNLNGCDAQMHFDQDIKRWYNIYDHIL